MSLLLFGKPCNIDFLSSTAKLKDMELFGKYELVIY
jgi:hypothetical protein